MLTLTQFANMLRKQFPTDKPIRVRRAQTPYSAVSDKIRIYGDAQENDDHYLIRLNKDHDLQTQKDTLMHEYAHCLAGWDGVHSSHNERWGIFYARIYRYMVGD